MAPLSHERGSSTFLLWTESKDNFNFERLEDIQNNKFEKLAALMNINQDTEEMNEYK